MKLEKHVHVLVYFISLFGVCIDVAVNLLTWPSYLQRIFTHILATVRKCWRCHLVCSVRRVKGFTWRLILIATEMQGNCMCWSQCDILLCASDVINEVPKCFFLQKVIPIFAIVLNRSLGIICLDISSSASPSWEGASYLRIHCLLIKALGFCAHCWAF